MPHGLIYSTIYSLSLDSKCHYIICVVNNHQPMNGIEMSSMKYTVIEGNVIIFFIVAAA